MSPVSWTTQAPDRLRAAVAVGTCLLVAGCSGVPWAPGPSFVPSPTPGSTDSSVPAASSAPSPASEPSITLSGTAETTDDLTARVDATLALRTDIAIVTNDITAVGTDYRFRGGCRRSDQATAPSAGGTGAPSAEPQPAPDQHAIAAATQPLTCADLFPT